jgi:diguanylate cyclase (GGDEF)-like protein
MKLLFWSDRLTAVVGLAIAATIGYAVAVLQRSVRAAHERQQQQQQMQSILRNTAALEQEILAEDASDTQTARSWTNRCETFADFEAALFHQINRLIAYGRRLQADLHSAHRLLQRRSAELRLSHTEARTDAVSSLFNRRGFDEMLEMYLELRRASGRHFGILMLDIDHFKQINDRCGHLIGDRVLSWVGTRLTEVVRPTDFVARLGGDEFAVLLGDVSLEQAKLVAARLMREFRAKPFVSSDGSVDVPVTLSIGVGVAEINDTADSLVHKADAALYRSKTHGRNRIFAGDECEPVPLACHGGEESRPYSAERIPSQSPMGLSHGLAD